MVKRIVAMENDGKRMRAFVMAFEVPDADFDTVSAVKKAATDFCKTKYGREIYEAFCRCFNWAYFDKFVTNDFCEPHGFKKLDSEFSSLTVDWNEHLVDDFEIGSE